MIWYIILYITQYDTLNYILFDFSYLSFNPYFITLMLIFFVVLIPFMNHFAINIKVYFIYHFNVKRWFCFHFKIWKKNPFALFILSSISILSFYLHLNFLSFYLFIFLSLFSPFLLCIARILQWSYLFEHLRWWLVTGTDRLGMVGGRLCSALLSSAQPSPTTFICCFVYFYLFCSV